MDPAITTLARLGLALLLGGSAAHKLRDRLRFQGILADYRLLPQALVPIAACLLVGVELGLAAGLLVAWTAPAAALAAAGVLTVYGLAIGINLARGRRDIDCGCGGPGQPLHPWLLARNAVLVGVCAVAALPVVPRPLSALDAVTVTLGLAGLALVWLASAELASRPRPHPHGAQRGAQGG